MNAFRSLAAAALALAASAAFAQTTVQDAWVRGTVPQQKSTGVFAQITSAQGGRLVAASTPVAAAAEVHMMMMEGSVMHMHALDDGLELPAGRPVTLAPGGYHIMLTGLKQPLKAGDVVPLTLVIEHADKTRETVELKAPVRALGQ